MKCLLPTDYFKIQDQIKKVIFLSKEIRACYFFLSVLYYYKIKKASFTPNNEDLVYCNACMSHAKLAFLLFLAIYAIVLLVMEIKKDKKLKIEFLSLGFMSVMTSCAFSWGVTSQTLLCMFHFKQKFYYSNSMS